jgi:hypothetical protein
VKRTHSFVNNFDKFTQAYKIFFPDIISLKHKILDLLYKNSVPKTEGTDTQTLMFTYAHPS